MFLLEMYFKLILKTLGTNVAQMSIVIIYAQGCHLFM